MSEEKAPAGAMQLQLQDFHALAAALALREIREHGAPMHGYFVAACALLYLEQVLRLAPEQGFENMMSCYNVIRSDPKLHQVVVRMMHEEINASRIVVPGSGRVN